MMSFYCHWRENCTSQFLLRNYSKHLFLKMIFIPQIMIHLSSNIFMLTIIKIYVLVYSAFSQSRPNNIEQIFSSNHHGIIKLVVDRKYIYALYVYGQSKGNLYADMYNVKEIV